MDELQIEKLRSSLISYQVNKGESGRALPWKSVLHKILMLPETAHCYPKDGSNPEFKEEALRRFAKNISLPSDDKLEDIKTYLIKVKFLSVAEFNAAAIDLEEMKVVHSYLANKDEKARRRLEAAQGVHESERKDYGVIERSKISLTPDPSGNFLRAEDEYEVFHIDNESHQDHKPPLPACKTNRKGFAFMATAMNVLYIFLRGASRDDMITYVESNLEMSLKGENLLLHRHGIRDLEQVDNLRQTNDPSYSVYKTVKGTRHERFKPAIGRVRPITEPEDINQRFITTAKKYNYEELANLLHQGADINTQDKDGMTALHYAAAYGARPCLRVLLKNTRCNFLIKNNNGNYASDLAMLWAKDYAVCKLLNKKQALQAYEQGANP